MRHRHLLCLAAAGALWLVVSGCGDCNGAADAGDAAGPATDGGSVGDGGGPGDSGAPGDGGGPADGGPGDLAGNCPAQPLTPAPAAIAEPVLRLSFGSGGGYRGSPQVLDADGDAVLDVLASEFDRVAAYSVGGVELWTRPINGRNFSGAVLADLDGSGAPEVLAGDNQGYVYAWTSEGTPLAGWPVQVNLAADVRSLAAADVDGDGADEAIVFSSLTDQGSEPNMYVYDGDGSVMAGWPHYGGGDPLTGHACDWCGGFNQNLAVGDLDGDGLLDLIFTQDRYSVSVFDALGAPRYVDGAFSWCGEAGLLHWGEIRSYIPPTAEFSAVCDSFAEILEFTYSPPLIADLDHDGTAELIALPNIESAGDIGPIVGSALAVYEPDRLHRPGFAPYPTSAGSLYPGGGWHEVNPVAVAANFQGDGALEILAVHLDGTVRLYDADGAELWSFTWSTTDNCLATEPVVADLDGDRVPEAAIAVACPGAAGSTFTVLGGEGGAPRLSAALPFRTIAAPLLTDLDGDAELELLFSSEEWSPSIHLYDWPGTDASCLIWPQGRGNPAHTGALQ